jgi:hypothetical protein
MADDAQSEAVVRMCLEQLDADAAEAATSYEDALYRLQATLIALKQQPPDEDPSPEAQQAVADALGRLHPSADDHLTDFGTRVLRLQAQVDIELSRWTSGMVQQPGPSGATVVAPRPPEAVA